jgi:hypothetical protein
MRTFTLVEEHEEIEVEADDQDGRFRHIFDHLRNIMICAALALAGTGIVAYRAELQFFGSTLNAAVGILLILTSSVLGGWNIVEGYKKILAPAEGSAKIWLYVLTLLLYGFLAFVLLQAGATMMQAKSPRATVSDIVADQVQTPVPLTLTLDCSLDPKATCTKSVIFISYIPDWEYQEGILASSIESFFMGEPLTWPDAEAPLSPVDQQISYYFSGDETQRAAQ